MLENIKSKNKIKGNLGENIVSEYINKCGYDILERNYKCKFGEIDIIFKDKKEIVFGEVKTRNGIKYGYPSESVTYFKKEHIWNTARYYLFEKGLLNKFIRFDVIEVYLNQKRPIINHIKSIFW